MPTGPKGQKRPADTNAAAVMVARIATGELEETPYVQSPEPIGRAGGEARADRLSVERRREIAKAGASARWKERKERVMTDCEPLMNALFAHPGREHVDVKFFVGSADDISVEAFCAEAAKMFAQMNASQEGDESFGEDFTQSSVEEALAVN